MIPFLAGFIKPDCFQRLLALLIERINVGAAITTFAGHIAFRASKTFILNSHKNLSPVPAGIEPYFVVVLAGRQARLRPPPRLTQFLLGTIFNLSMEVQY